METVTTCPLGHICEEARDGKIYRCAWYVHMGVADEDTGQMDPASEYDVCSIPALGAHMTELKKRTIGVQSAVESRGNKIIKRQDDFISLVRDTMSTKGGPHQLKKARPKALPVAEPD